MLKLIFRYWLYVLIVCIIAYVSLFNLHHVTFNLFGIGSYNLTLAGIIILSFFVGVSITVLYFLCDWVKHVLEVKKLKKKILMFEDLLKDKINTQQVTSSTKEDNTNITITPDD